MSTNRFTNQLEINNNKSYFLDIKMQTDYLFQQKIRVYL